VQRISNVCEIQGTTPEARKDGGTSWYEKPDTHTTGYSGFQPRRRCRRNPSTQPKTPRQLVPSQVVRIRNQRGQDTQVSVVAQSPVSASGIWRALILNWFFLNAIPQAKFCHTGRAAAELRKKSRK
jgi:hypothetical protein